MLWVSFEIAVLCVFVAQMEVELNPRTGLNLPLFHHFPTCYRQTMQNFECNSGVPFIAKVFAGRITQLVAQITRASKPCILQCFNRKWVKNKYDAC